MSWRLEAEGNAMDQSVVSMSPDVLSGAAVFRGTRVPIRALIDYLEGDHTIDEFLLDFPSVTREQVIQLLEEARERLSKVA